MSGRNAVPHTVYPRWYPPFLLLLQPGGNKSIPDALPLVTIASLKWTQSDRKPETERPTALAPYPLSASLSKPSRSLLPSPPTIPPWRRSPVRALANKFTLQRCPQSRESNQLGQKGPRASAILQRRPLLLALSNPMCNSPCQYLSKRHYRHFRTVCPKVTGFMGGFVVVFFICFCFFVLKLCLYPHLMENVPLG